MRKSIMRSLSSPPLFFLSLRLFCMDRGCLLTATGQNLKKTRQSHHKAAATEHDGLINAKKFQTGNLIMPDSLSTPAQAERKRPLFLTADIATRL